MRDDRTYVIDPADTDPALIRSVVPLGEPAAAPSSTRRARDGQIPRQAAPAAAAPPPPAHPALFLCAAYLCGPAAVFLTAAGRRRRARRILAVAALGGAGLAALIAWQAPAQFGPGDAAILWQVASAGLAAVVWVVAWATGLMLASRRCGDGPWARPGQRRPAAAAFVGLFAPGLGLLLAGHARRSVATTATVFLAVLAGLALRQGGAWWAWHRQAAPDLISDLQFEQGVVVLAGLAAAGALGWLVSALDAARLATGPRVMRRVAAANRAPAALLVALVALGVFFRPVDLARNVDLVTQRLIQDGLRLLPACTAAIATRLDPAEPVYAWRLAARQADLGWTAAAAATRDDLAARWQRYRQAEAASRLPAD